jgi:iron complex outermembrane recepter protein
VKKSRLLHLSILTGVLSFIAIEPIRANESSKRIDHSQLELDANAQIPAIPPAIKDFVPPSTALSGSAAPTPKISEMSELAPLSNRAADLMAQDVPTEQGAEITGVNLQTTATGIEIKLETTAADSLPSSTQVEGNTLVTNIDNAVLALPEGQSFRQETPTKGVTEVTVTQVAPTQVQVRVTGVDAPPVADVTTGAEGVVLAVTPGLGEEGEIEITVTAEQEEENAGYQVPDATTATRTTTPLKDIPQSVKIIPQQVLEDQNVQSLQEALKNVAGVAPGDPTLSPFDGFAIRGFFGGNSANTLYDGLDDAADFAPSANFANVERVEVLKGPASVLFGQATPGGTINFISKKPQRDPRYTLEATLGNFDLYSGRADLTGPLNADKTLLYRLNVSAQESNTYVDFVDNDRYSVAPTLSWQITPQTKLTFAAEYLDFQQINNIYLPARGTILPNPNGQLPINRFSGEPRDFDNNRFLRVGYDLEHQFSQNWQLRHAFRYSHSNRQIQATFLDGLSEDGRLVERSGFATDVGNGGFFNNSFNTDTYISGKFATGPIRHELVAGFNLSRNIATGRGQSYTLQPLDLYDPVYGSERGDFSPSDDTTTSDNLGFYVQDLISLTDNLKLLIGGRFDSVRAKVEDRIAPENNSSQQNSAFSPRVGLVYQPIKPISLYASFSQSFEQVTGQAFDQQLFEPERGTQYEIGVKADITQKLSATLALYQLTRSNVLTTDPINQEFSIQTGEQRSRGVEVDIGGEILPGWNIIASYAYTDARLTQDEDFPVGNRLEGAPTHGFSLWTTYEIQKGVAKGLGFGAGLFYVGDRPGDLYQLRMKLHTMRGLPVVSIISILWHVHSTLRFKRAKQN